MSDLTVRDLNLDFAGIDFIWNPGQPAFSFLANVISFQTVGFERFICKTVHEALAELGDPALKAEARDFLDQEAQHSKAHMAHVKGLIGRYPELRPVFDEAMADFDRKWAASDQPYRIAYSAIIEGTSLPLYKIMIDHRDTLILGGDERVSALLLWHFSEEIEHRSSALKIYNAVVRKPFYRLKLFPEVGGHLARNMNRIAHRFAEIVPEAAGVDLKQAMASVPRWDRVRMTASLLASQLPTNNPARGAMPQFCKALLGKMDAAKPAKAVAGHRVS
jgi:predicted metal-dependent hydrolase